VRVILNADDLGLTEPITDAVLEALARGHVTSASLVANGPAFDRAVIGLARLNEPCVGVHLNLTEGEPLTDRVGTIWGPDAWKADRSAHSAIVAEWTAQVCRVLAAGIHPTHLDTHMHLHWQPPLLAALREVAETFGVRKVRPMGAWRTDVAAWRALPHRARAALYNRRLRRWAVTPDAFGSVTVLRDLRPQVGTFEAMAHPGNPAHPRYAEELDWLRSHAGSLRRISWRDL
jgi:predicted glycoside hydrolase/deacetylase ChbG (UPF0249 family)